MIQLYLMCSYMSYVVYSQPQPQPQPQPQFVFRVLKPTKSLEGGLII